MFCFKVVLLLAALIMAMKRVLMLGWEFPPLFAGGLGVATYHLARALHSQVHLQLILPATQAKTVDGLSLIGLNHLEDDAITIDHIHDELRTHDVRVEAVPVSISPYHHVNVGYSRSESILSPVGGHLTAKDVRDLFSSNEVYGRDIMRKVYIFSTLASQQAAKMEFDVIHAHDWVTYPAAIKIRHQSGKPILLHVHALETDRAGDDCRNEIYHLERNAFEAADHIVAVSQYTQQRIIELYGIAPGKITVVHNGIEPVTRQRKKRNIKEKLVVFLGRLTHQKGPQFLLETAGKVVQVFPNVKFVVAGTGDQFGYLLETAAWKRVGSRFIFTGFLSKTKVDELLSMADVYFMPSVSEPFGLTALEAAQHSVPSVISSQSGVAEVLRSSLKADYWDTDKFANYIFALLNYHALAASLGKNASDQAQRVTWDDAAAKLMTIYHSLSR